MKRLPLIDSASPVTLAREGIAPLHGIGRLPAPVVAPETRWIAIVGARAASGQAARAAFALARELAAAPFGHVIVSGGAVGIDAAAHEGALAARGVTIAVLGSGLDLPYPERNLDLFRRIATSPAGGAVLSPFPLGTPPLRGNFPRRNESVAALASAVIVVEAGLRSGASITARAARRLGRPVLARPGSPGTERLLDDGAFVCETAGDVRLALAGRGRARTPDLDGSRLTPAARAVLAALAALGARGSRSTLDEIAFQAGLNAGETTAALVRLEIDGIARRAAGGGAYTLAPSITAALAHSGSAS